MSLSRVMQVRDMRVRGRVGAAATVVVCLGLLAGCGGRGSSVNPAANAASQAAALGVGQMIAADVPAAGEVVLVHRSGETAVVRGWIAGLVQGASINAASVVEFGPQQMSEQGRNSMGGFAALREAIERYPSARAIVTTDSIGSFEQPSFPVDHPPVYALDWTDVASSAFLFRRPDLAGGVFLRPDYDGAPVDAKADPQAVFDQMYVKVNQQNIRDVIRQYPGR